MSGYREIIVPASLYRRFFAFAFDWMIIFFMFLMMLVAGSFGLEMRSGGFEEVNSGIDGISFTFLSRLWLFLFIAYHTFFLYFGGQTLSKMLFKIRVIPYHRKGTLTIFQAFLRSVSYLLSMVFFLGFLLAFITRNNRSLHDYLAGTWVIESAICLDGGRTVENGAPAENNNKTFELYNDEIRRYL